MRKWRLTKRIVCIGLVFLLNINAIVAIVSDNDGSAFITKAEFDLLKNNFQSQIDAYNQGIDSKIDAAISTYLSGIKISTERDGINIIKNISNKRPVRFYNYSSNGFNTSTLDNIKVKYLWRLFGNYYNPTIIAGSTWNSKLIEGGFLQDLFSGSHTRGFDMSAKGNDINYQYQTKEYSYPGGTYWALESNESKSFQCTVGAYYYYLGSTISWDGKTLPNAYTFTTRDVSIDYKTNTIEPGTITYNLGFETVTLNGAEWNIWKKTDNGVDCDFVYDFTNTAYDYDKLILAYDINDFNNWTVQDTLKASKYGVDADFWFSFFGTGGAYKRTYTYLGYNAATNESGTITGTVPSKTSYSTMKYYRPRIESIKAGWLIHGDASAQINSAVKPFFGVPFTKKIKGAEKLTAKLKIEIYNGSTLKSNAGYTVLLRTQPFDNVNSSAYISGLIDPTVKKFVNSTGTTNFDIELDKDYLEKLNEDDVIYMRVMPATTGYNAVVDCSEIKFEVKE